MHKNNKHEFYQNLHNIEKSFTNFYIMRYCTLFSENLCILIYYFLRSTFLWKIENTQNRKSFIYLNTYAYWL